MKPLHLKHCIDASIFRFCADAYRSRFITNAKHPANNPPPKIVVPNERYAPAPLPGEAPSSRSRTPPCTISTERVSNAPIANHHLKDLTGVLETERQEVCAALIGHCSRGSAGCQEDRLLIHSTYRQTSYALTRGMRQERAPLSILDGERWRHYRCRCPLSQVRALQPLSW